MRVGIHRPCYLPWQQGAPNQVNLGPCIHQCYNLPYLPQLVLKMTPDLEAASLGFVPLPRGRRRLAVSFRASTPWFVPHPVSSPSPCLCPGANSALGSGLELRPECGVCVTMRTEKLLAIGGCGRLDLPEMLPEFPDPSMRIVDSTPPATAQPSSHMCASHDCHPNLPSSRGRGTLGV